MEQNMNERKILAVVNGGMKFYTLAVVAMAMLTACMNDGAGEVMNHETAEVQITFSPYDVEPMMRAAVADYATRMDVWIYDGDTEVQAVHQQSTDEGFASLSLRLEKAKTYTVYACAHKAAGAATLNNGVVSWPDDKVTHSFFYSQSFSPATTTTLNCLMERIVGNFRLEIADKVPEGVARMTVDLGLSPTRWNVAGFGENAVSRVSSFTPAVGASPTLSVFLLAGSEEEKRDITVTAYDGEDAVVQQRVFSDVPIRASYRSTYRGAFFTEADEVMTFTVNDWMDYETVEF
ncbi:MAG: hypothetical protein J6C44_09475 [Muribaculaceae bacterium]|nr:hypothetical protein [Muribaculaceae bacterium]